MQKYSDVVLSKITGTETIQAVSGASVLVKTLAGAVADIYSDDASTPLSNPVSSDANGRFFFYAADGRYTLEISAANMVTQTITDIIIEDPSDGLLTLASLEVTGDLTVAALDGYLTGTLGLMGAVATIPYTDITGTPDAFLFVGTSNEVTVAEFPTGTFTFSLPASINANLVGNVTGNVTGNLTGNPTAPTPAAGDNDTSVATTAFVEQAVPNSSYRNMQRASGNILAGVTAGTFNIGDGNTLTAAASGVGGTNAGNTISSFYIDPADYPTVDGKTTKLRVLSVLLANDVAPTGNFTIGLYPITRPGTSGGASNQIITLGTVVPGSTVTFTTPAADSMNQANSGDFAIPTAGWYVFGMVTTATVAASSRVDVSATLQMRNT